MLPNFWSDRFPGWKTRQGAVWTRSPGKELKFAGRRGQLWENQSLSEMMRIRNVNRWSFPCDVLPNPATQHAKSDKEKITVGKSKRESV